jgi:hypothetical protein
MLDGLCLWGNDWVGEAEEKAEGCSAEQVSGWKTCEPAVVQHSTRKRNDTHTHCTEESREERRKERLGYLQQQIDTTGPCKFPPRRSRFFMASAGNLPLRRRGVTHHGKGQKKCTTRYCPVRLPIVAAVTLASSHPIKRGFVCFPAAVPGQSLGCPTS